VAAPRRSWTLAPVPAQVMATQKPLWTQPQDARIDDGRCSFFPPRGAAHTHAFRRQPPDSTTAATKIRTSASPGGSPSMKLQHFRMQGERDMPGSKSRSPAVSCHGVMCHPWLGNTGAARGFRSAPRTCRLLCGRLSMRQTARGAVGGADTAQGRKSPCPT
jgi:hypothetical protein